MKHKQIERLLRDAAYEGIIKCSKCGNSLEPDAEKCHCGWVNPLRRLGYI